MISLSVKDLGEYIRAEREHRGATQDDLAKAISPVTNRSVVAHLEQGRRVPPPEVLTKLCEYLDLPKEFWEGFCADDYLRRLSFEHALSELVGRSVGIQHHTSTSSEVAHQSVINLFRVGLTSDQAFDAFNSILVFYDVLRCSRAFFDRFLGPKTIQSPESLAKAVADYQQVAIRLFSTFELAYAQFNSTDSLDSILEPLKSRSDEAYRQRAPWNVIEIIPNERLPDLGYISAQNIRQERTERDALAAFLRELANSLSDDKSSLDRIHEKRKRKMDSLLRKFQSQIHHRLDSPLFPLEPDELRREAEFLAPKGEADLGRMADTQAMGERNLARYLSADHLDVYVATSMRSDADGIDPI